MANTFDSTLVLKLWDVFPDSFSTVKTFNVYETYNGRFGTEEILAGTCQVVLSECILNTAHAIQIKYGLDSCLDYIEEFKTKRVQQNEIKNFLKA